MAESDPHLQKNSAWSMATFDDESHLWMIYKMGAHH